LGDDDMGQRLRSTLDEAGVDTSGLLVDRGRPTSVKTRVLARGTQEVQQQIVRIDRVDDRPVSEAIERRLADATCAGIENGSSLLISDYETGAISPYIIDTCLPFAIERGAVITVDSHGDLFRFHGVTAATPNQPEVESTVGHSLRSEDDLDSAARELLDRLGAASILVTRGSEGIALYEPGKPPRRFPAVQSETQVVDPTGAGDTVAAVFTLAIAAGAAPIDAAALANVAGGIVVRRLGAATVGRKELWEAAQNAGLITGR
jgi:rfaE bifunctional protein kinase chain/domain